MIKNEYDWCLAGKGATGQVLAYKLKTAGLRVCFLSHKQQASPVEFTYQTPTSPPVKWQCPVIHYQQNTKILIKKLLITTKAYSVKEVLKQWQRHMNEQTRIYFWQNGRGFINANALAQPNYCIVNAGIAAYRNGENSVIHTAHNPVFVGSNAAHSKPTADILELQQSDIELEWREDIELQSWLKVAINSIINPLTVLYSCRNGELIKISKAKSQIEQLSQECANAFSANKIPLSAEEIKNKCVKVIQKTQSHYSSMLQDYKQGHSKSEIEFLNEQIIKIGLSKGVKVDTHTHVKNLVKKLFDNN